MSNYTMKYEDDRYVIYEDQNVLRTVKGNPVITMYKPIADRIINDISLWGLNYWNVGCILSWHYTLLDNFKNYTKEDLQVVLKNAFFKVTDWTCTDQLGDSWENLFGNWEKQKNNISVWLSRMTHMQMTAACCIGNAYNSLNIPFILAEYMEAFEGEDIVQGFKTIATLLQIVGGYGDLDEILHNFMLFKLYYGIHLDEFGALLPDFDKHNLIVVYDKEESEEELDVDFLDEYSVSIDALVGRGFYHYTDAEKDYDQPGPNRVLEINPDIFTTESTDDDWDSDEEDEGGDSYSADSIGKYGDPDKLSEFLPDDCWVKRFVDDENGSRFYLLYIEVDEDGNIIDSGCIEENRHNMSSGFFFCIPGMKTETRYYYENNSYPPKKVIEELKLLFSEKYMPLDFKFIGKKLPQKILEIDGGLIHHTLTLQSAYRLAYMHLTINTTREGIINGFTYQTFASTGNAYGDMFNRPDDCWDLTEEVVDVLNYLYDMYTDDETEQLDF